MTSTFQRLELGGRKYLRLCEGRSSHHFHSQESRGIFSARHVEMEVKLKRDAQSKLCRPDDCPGE